MRHIGIIMDGNGRWAESRSLPRSVGHLKGAEALCRAVADFADLNVDIMTFYAFSTENAKRERNEVVNLTRIMDKFLSEEIDGLLEKYSLRARFIGNKKFLPDFLVKTMEEIAVRRHEGKKTVVFAIGYGGTDEVVSAINKIFRKRVETGDFSDITATELAENLFTDGLPDPDGILRYGEYRRLSNFMPLQSTYSELFFTEKLWPDYDKRDIEDVLTEFETIKRNFGGN